MRFCFGFVDCGLVQRGDEKCGAKWVFGLFCVQIWREVCRLVHEREVEVPVSVCERNGVFRRSSG